MFGSFSDLLVTFGALGGVGALIAVFVNVLKTVGVVKDGQAPLYATGLNLLGLVALFVLGIVRPDANLQAADQLASDLATVLTVVFGFVWQLASSKFTHRSLSGVPVLGKSYSPFPAEAARIKSYASEILRRD